MTNENTENEVDRYINQQPEAVQRALQALRAIIKTAAPDAQELINYQIPAFALVPGGKRDQQVMMAGHKNHIGFYPHPTAIEKFADELKPYKSAKGSVQFPLNKPIPKALVLKMVRFRLAEVQKKG